MATDRTARRDERGVVAIIVAITMSILLVIAALVVDIAMARHDRQVSKSATDSAVMAGLRAVDGGTADIYTKRGVCAALSFLRANEPALAALPDGICDASAMTSNVTCQQANPAAALTDYQASTTSGDVTYTVRIKSPYLVTEGSFDEESYASLSSDLSNLSGCDQIGVIVTKSRPPLFGGIAGGNGLTTTIRSVGRVHVDPGKSAPALLLLKQTGCPILQTGSTSGDSTIRVYGWLTADGNSAPGTIHADSTGAGCSGGSNQNVFLGRAPHGIVALAAPLASDPSQPDPTKPGMITSVAALQGHGQGVGYDHAAHVFGSGSVDPAGIAAASKTPVIGRSLVTRRLHDARYLDAVRDMKDAANSIFNTVNASTPGWKVITGCDPVNSAVAALNLTAADRLYVNCTANNGYNSPVSLAAGTIVFAGKVNPSALLSLPNATKVYVHGSGSDAIVLSGGGGLAMHTAGNMNGSLCSESVTSATNKAVLVVKSGQIKQSNGGVLRACYTTMLMMGGYADACLPTYTAIPDALPPPPTQTPCGTNNAMGNGQLSQTGGDVDWTAPNSLDVTLDAEGVALPQAVTAWRDANGPEDLAFWSESAGNNSSTTYNMNGQGVLHTVGVYMVPNADSFSIGGGASQALTNAQYIATSIALNGAGTSISMRVDPNSAVALPELNLFTLVR